MSAPHLPKNRHAYTTSAIQALAALSLPTLLIAGGFVAPTRHPEIPGEAHNVTAAPQQVVLTCLDVMLDPYNAQQTQHTQQLIVREQGTQEKINTEHDQHAVIWENTPGKHLHALTLAAQSGGDLRGISLLPCTQPLPQHWFAAGYTTSGEDTLIRLTNPAQIPATVIMKTWGKHGPSTSQTNTFTIPAHSATTLRPGIQAANEERLGISLVTNGPGIGAWLLSSAMKGETPQGTSWINSTQLRREHFIPGISDLHTTVRMLNPHDTPTHITLELLTSHGPKPIPGGDATLEAQSVTDIPIPHIDTDYATLRVRAEENPIVVQASAQAQGKQWAHGPVHWQSRHLLNSVRPHTNVTLPTPQALTRAVNSAAKTPPLRSTSINTASGLKITRTHLIVTNASENNADLTLNHTKTTIPARHTVTLDAADLWKETLEDMATISSDTEVYMALAVQIENPQGDLTAVYPLTTPDLTHATVAMVNY